MSGSIGFSERGDARDIETGSAFAPKFGPDGLIPAVAAEAGSGRVLMLAHMNAEAVARTIATGEAHYYSRSRQALWKKGERSGHVQKVVEIRTDCDQDTVLLLVEQRGPGACHVGYESCFYRRLEAAAGSIRLVTTDPRAYDPGGVYRGGD